jgi:glyoxylase-like metal-dependent hydrolase (beta-lactamase superfamily II)
MVDICHVDQARPIGDTCDVPTRLPVADHWFERTRIDDAITLLIEPHVNALLQCNIWHLRGRDRDLLIDTGLGVASLAEAAADLFAADLLAIATHAHTDHVGSMYEFGQRAIHAAEVDTISNISGALNLDVDEADEATLAMIDGWGYDIRGGLVTAIPYEGFELNGPARHPAPPTRVLEDGDVIDAGDRAFEVLHVPGHSPGSIALWEPATAVLFSGDAVYDGPLLDEIEGADIDVYIATMHTLRALPVDTVHGGHGPSMDRRRFHEVIDAYLVTRA